MHKKSNLNKVFLYLKQPLTKTGAGRATAPGAILMSPVRGAPLQSYAEISLNENKTAKIGPISLGMAK